MTPNVAKWRQSLIEENDVALFSTLRADHSSVSYLNRVEIKELPTSEHLIYFLTTLYTHSNSSASYQAFKEVNGTRLNPDPSYLPLEPTMVILHQPSDYLAEDKAQTAGLEAYTSLLAMFESAFTQLSPRSPPLLVLYDNDASSLEQPILASHLAQPPKMSYGSRKRRIDDDEDDDAEEGREKRVDKVKLRDVLGFFYDWVAEVEPVPNSSQRASAFVLTYTPALRRSDLPLLTSSTSKTENRAPIAVEFSVQRISEAEGDDEDGLLIQVVN